MIVYGVISKERKPCISSTAVHGTFGLSNTTFCLVNLTMQATLKSLYFFPSSLFAYTQLPSGTWYEHWTPPVFTVCWPFLAIAYVHKWALLYVVQPHAPPHVRFHSQPSPVCGEHERVRHRNCHMLKQIAVTSLHSFCLPFASGFPSVLVNVYMYLSMWFVCAVAVRI